MSLDGRNISRPTSLISSRTDHRSRPTNGVGPNRRPTNHVLDHAEVTDLILSIGGERDRGGLCRHAAYAFARFHFPGRKWGLFLFISVLMLPIGRPLWRPFSSCSVRSRSQAPTKGAQHAHRVGIAYTSGALPFAIWNLRGYIDTLPREMEESALVDGAGPNRAFFDVILPLIAPRSPITDPLWLHGIMGPSSSGWDLPDRSEPVYARHGD